MDSYGAFKLEALDGEERYVDRHSISLEAAASANGEAAPVHILNLSATGLLVRTERDLDVGAQIDVELPMVGMQRAQVVWCGDGIFGCEFTTPVSTAAVSAARLRSSPAIEQTDAPIAEIAEIAEPRAVPMQIGESAGLTLRRKTATIVGLAIASWGVVIGGVMLVL